MRFRLSVSGGICRAFLFLNLRLFLRLYMSIYILSYQFIKIIKVTENGIFLRLFLRPSSCSALFLKLRLRSI